MLRAVTVTPGTTASELSLTVPVSEARSTCAAAFDAFSTRTGTKKRRAHQDRMGFLQTQERAERILPHAANVKRRLRNDFAPSIVSTRRFPRSDDVIQRLGFDLVRSAGLSPDPGDELVMP